MAHGHTLIDFGPLEPDGDRDAFTALASLGGNKRRITISRTTLLSLAKGQGGTDQEIFHRNRDLIATVTADKWEIGHVDDPVSIGEADF
jgi:hypothetical protein